MKRAVIIVFIVILLDQVLKFWVKLNMFHSESIPVFGNWFYLYFIENSGMAFGWQIAGEFGKLFLSVFRVFAIFAIGWYLYSITKHKYHWGLTVSIALIFAGALGNLIDSAFYGMIFSESPRFTQDIATLFPDGGGYGTFLHGSVVDMFYFPLFHGIYPEWVPGVGGNNFTFFAPVFNLADSSITIGVIILILFQRKFFRQKTEETTDVIAEDLVNQE